MATRREAGTEPMAGRMMGEARTEPRERMQQARTQGEGLTEKVKNRAKETVEGGKERVAGRIEDVGHRIDNRAERMEMEGGLKGQAGKAMKRAGDAIEGGADYLRTHEIGSIRDDVTNQIRSHPFVSVGLALGTGFVLGRAMGGGDEEEQERLERRLRRMSSEREERGGGLKQQLGHALVGGLSGLVERQVRGR